MRISHEILSHRSALLLAAGALVGAWGGPLIARSAAHAGESSLSFTGTLKDNGAPISTPQELTFSFKKVGAVVCSVPGLPVTPDANGQFTVAIPLSGCPATLFDGAEVNIDIAVGGNAVVTDQPITSVPSAKYADQVGFSDCPFGYDRDKSLTNIVLCRRGTDEVVRAGVRSSAFWIDRYEASVWEFPDGTGISYGGGIADYPFPINGQVGATEKGYAVSKVGVLPSTAITWFQADVVCRAGGKRLATSAEWGFAARGTADPGESAGPNGACRTLSGNLRVTGQGTACVSQWGAEDMIGNAAEFTSEWAAAPPIATDTPGIGNADYAWSPYPGFNNDGITNLASIAGTTEGWKKGLPVVVTRGGGIWEGMYAGIFELNLTVPPQASHPGIGFRCVVTR
jgi:formylglycine-generating enzyme required for sulfatase activity